MINPHHKASVIIIMLKSSMTAEVTKSVFDHMQKYQCFWCQLYHESLNISSIYHIQGVRFLLYFNQCVQQLLHLYLLQCICNLFHFGFDLFPLYTIFLFLQHKVQTQNSLPYWKVKEKSSEIISIRRVRESDIQ